ncbi:MAG TPA: CPBP family glutamic-type intramembrane protease [Candidatus Dormibacteraeota bacterium]|nr:CPBP family glutamic-type intramembrane protease [Candidatus Dormibacteraeota bacterium]
MSGLALPHVAAVVFFAVLLVFERARRSPALSFVRHPMFAYLARGALALGYFAFIGVDPFPWFAGAATLWLLAAAVGVVAIAVIRRRDVAALARGQGGMLTQAAYLAVVVAVVEELIFRGAFVLVAAVTPATTVLASAGASAAYVVWRALVYRDREPRSLAIVFAASFALGLLAGLSRSLWPPVIVHGGYVLLAGPPRAPRRVTPSAARP